MTTNITKYMDKFNCLDILQHPQIIGLVGDVNTGKSMLLYDLISNLKSKYKFSLRTFGLKLHLGDIPFYSLQELEQITNSIIIIDEFPTLLEIEDRKQRVSVEKTLRLINHNNNILILSSTGESFKKFLMGKIDVVMFKKVTIKDLLNGGKIKRIATNYRGNELGQDVLNIPIDKTLIFDGKTYHLVDVKYHKEYDTKLKNRTILVPKDVLKSVPKCVPKGVLKNVPISVPNKEVSDGNI